MSQISPTHALLLLLKKYGPTHENNEEKYKTLSHFLFSGRNPGNAERFDAFLVEAETDTGHIVNKTPDFIHNDPVRRHFETQVAHEFLKDQLSGLTLGFFKQTFFSTLLSFKTEMQLVANIHTRDVLLGKDTTEDRPSASPASYEFSHAIKEIQDGTKEYSDFSPEEREKLSFLIKTSYFLSRVTFIRDNLSSQEPATLRPLPLNLYREGMYLPENKGHEKRLDQDDSITSNTFGIMKSSHPMPLYDPAIRTETTRYNAPDRSTFTPDAPWPKEAFETLTDPFTNALSGTMLGQLRSLYESMREDPDKYAELRTHFPTYLTLVASALLFVTGGHSYHEFMAPLKFPDVVTAFNETLGIDLGEFDYADLLLKEGGLSSAVLNICLGYADTFQKRESVQEALKEAFSRKSSEIISGSSTDLSSIPSISKTPFFQAFKADIEATEATEATTMMGTFEQKASPPLS